MAAQLGQLGEVGHAREHLISALEVFVALGARAWSDWARAELRALGGGPGAGARPSTDLLTAREADVARLWRNGASNRDAAGSLFVNAKTVEYHLANVYRKLGVRTRTELALAWRDVAAHQFMSPHRSPGTDVVT